MIDTLIATVSVTGIILAVILAYTLRRALRAEARVSQLTAPVPKPSPAQAKLMGLDSPGDQKVPITVRDWDALKRALWRSKIVLEIAERQASVILAECSHMPLCPGKTSETEPCFQGCVDREKRLSACVILAAARQLTAAVNARKPPDGPYYAPTREYFSEMLSALAAAQVEIEMLRAALQRMGVDPMTIALTLDSPPTPAQLEEPK
jgi:hypothetical protein